MKNSLALRHAISTCLVGQSIFSGSYVQAEEGLKLEEVVVQARREEENLQSVPVAVTAISADTLKTMTVTSIDDLQRLAPSLTIAPDNTGAQQFKIRGSFTEQFTDPSVVTYVDEVPVDPRVLAYSLYDTASVQQLKGPQGTLFGKNTTGGAVLFFTQKPKQTDEGYVRVRLGEYNERYLEGAFNTPVTDTLAIRIAGQKETRDGFIDSVTDTSKDYNNRDNYSIRAAANWIPTDRLTNFTQITHYDVDQLAAPATTKGPAPVRNSALAPFANAITAVVQSYYVQQQALRDDQTIQNFDTTEQYQYDAITNITTYELNPVTLKNIIYYGKIDQFFAKDFAGLAKNIDFYQAGIDSTYDNFYEELQVYGTALDEKFKWRAGANYSSTDGDETYNISSLNFLLGPFAPPSGNDTHTQSESKALFGQLSYDLSSLLDGLNITAGYRETWDSRKLSKRAYNKAAAGNVCTLNATDAGVDIANCQLKLDNDYSDYNYNLTIDWHISDNALLYAATRRGYKSGGFNTSATSADNTEFQPETVEDFELGMKADWNIGDVQLRTNLAVYRAKYDSLQLTSQVTDGTQLRQLVLNIGSDGKANEATFDGFEAEVVVIPTDWLQVSAFFAQVDTEFDHYLKNPTTDLSGQPVGGVIPKSYGVTATVNLPVPQTWGDLIFTANYFGADAGEKNVDTNTTLPRQDQVNVRLAFNAIAGSSADLAIYGKNVTDKRWCSYTDLGLGAPYEICGAPSQWGVEAAYRF